MKSNRNFWSVTIALVVLTCIAALPAAAEAGGPVLDYLQTTVKPLLDSIQAAVANAQTSINSMRTTIDLQPKLAIVKTKFTTLPNSASVFNLDVHSVPTGQLSSVKRYTTTLTPAVSFGGVTTGLDRIRVVVCAFDGATSVQADVASYDPAGTQGSYVSTTYAGTNSFVRVDRGADGLGPVDVIVSSYIESEP